MTNPVCYEQPLNERIRTLLRLEFLFHQSAYASAGESEWDSRAALQALLEILEITAHNDVKSELIKELERQAGLLTRLRQTPGVDSEALDGVLADIGQAVDCLRRLSNQGTDAVRTSDFLIAIRQRSIIPGGTCRFDLPGLHYWLKQPHAVRSQHLQDWLAPFRSLQDGVDLILQLIRNCARPQTETARQGFFQKNLGSGLPSQMVRVILPQESAVFPEISAGRHRFVIRFMEQPDPGQRANQTAADILFQLVYCVI